MAVAEPDGAGVGIGVAQARAALAGNPSDGYGGAVLATTLPGHSVRAIARRAPELRVTPPAELVAAAARRFAREIEPAGLETAIEWTTSIPRAVGLGGSSAIVIATLRALCELHRVELEPIALAACALAVETEDLGIAAGPQDRIAQAYGGVTFMDFARDGGRYERLDPARLPPLLVAWRAHAGEHSGEVHEHLRRRYERGDPGVRDAIDELAAAAHRAWEAVVAGDGAELARCADTSFDTRRKLMALDPRHVEMVELARECGAGANYTGSGGAIVAVCRDDRHRAVVREALAGSRCGVLCVG